MHSTGRSERSSCTAANSGCTSAHSSCSHSVIARRCASVGPGTGNGMQRVGSSRAAQRGVEPEQLEEDARPRACRSRHDDGSDDPLVSDGRFRPPPLCHEQTRAQRPQQLLTRHEPPDDREVRRVAGVDERDEA